MSRFGPDPWKFFDSVYEGVAPWDIGDAQPALLELFSERPPQSPVLDVGCGTGDLAIALATRGADVLGLDFVEAAIIRAREVAESLPAEISRRVEFETADALHPSRLNRRFHAVVDSGFFHLFDSVQRDAFRDELEAVLEPGGRYYLLAFAVEFPVPNTPLRVTEEELRERFTATRGWHIETLRPASFESRIAPVPALAACIRWRRS